MIGEQGWKRYGNGYNFFTIVIGIERMIVGYGNVMFIVAGKIVGELE